MASIFLTISTITTLFLYHHASASPLFMGGLSNQPPSSHYNQASLADIQTQMFVDLINNGSVPFFNKTLGGGEYCCNSALKEGSLFTTATPPVMNQPSVSWLPSFSPSSSSVVELVDQSVVFFGRHGTGFLKQCLLGNYNVKLGASGNAECGGIPTGVYDPLTLEQVNSMRISSKPSCCGASAMSPAFTIWKRTN